MEFGPRALGARSIIGDALEKYREVIHPAKLELVYKNVSEISKDPEISDLPPEIGPLETPGAE